MAVVGSPAAPSPREETSMTMAPPPFTSSGGTWPNGAMPAATSTRISGASSAAGVGPGRHARRPVQCCRRRHQVKIRLLGMLKPPGEIQLTLDLDSNPHTTNAHRPAAHTAAARRAPACDHAATSLYIVCDACFVCVRTYVRLCTSYDKQYPTPHLTRHLHNNRFPQAHRWKRHPGARRRQGNDNDSAPTLHGRRRAAPTLRPGDWPLPSPFELPGPQNPAARAFRAEPGMADFLDASSVWPVDGDGRVLVAVVFCLVVRGRRGGVATGGDCGMIHSFIWQFYHD